MRYDFEMPLAESLANFLRGHLDAAMQAECPVVAFTDPMSLDEAHRIVVRVLGGESDALSCATIAARAVVIVKSRWTQPTLQNDFVEHSARTNAVRDALAAGDLLDRLALSPVTGLAYDFVFPTRTMSTEIFTEGWIVSETELTIKIHVTEE